MRVNFLPLDQALALLAGRHAGVCGARPGAASASTASTNSDARVGETQPLHINVHGKGNERRNDGVCFEISSRD